MWEPKIVRKSLRAAGFWAFPNREPVKVELYRLDWNFTEDFVVAVSGDGEGAGFFQMQPGVRFPKVSDGGRQYVWSFNDQEDQLFISLKDAIDYGRSFNGNGSIAWSALASDNTDYTREITSAEAESIVGACLGAAEPIGYRSEPTKTTIDFETNDGMARLITFVDYWTGDEIGDKRIGLPEKTRAQKQKEILALHEEIYWRAATIDSTLSAEGHLHLKFDDAWSVTCRAFDRFTDDYDWCGWLLLMPSDWVAAGKDQIWYSKLFPAALGPPGSYDLE